jgi:hypothetical protein
MMMTLLLVANCALMLQPIASYIWMRLKRLRAMNTKTKLFWMPKTSSRRKKKYLLANPPVVECTDVQLITKNVTGVTELETTLLGETILYVKAACLEYLKDGQTAADSLFIALKVYKTKLDVHGKEWEKLLLDDFDIKPGRFRVWDFRHLNYLLTGKRTGDRDGNGGTRQKKEKKVPSGLTAEQIKANANLKQAKEEFGAAAEAGNEQAKTYLASYEEAAAAEAAAGVSTTEIEVPEPQPDLSYAVALANLVLKTYKEMYDTKQGPSNLRMDALKELADMVLGQPTDYDKRMAADAAKSVPKSPTAPAKKKRGRPSNPYAAADEIVLRIQQNGLNITDELGYMTNLAEL